MIIVGGSLVVSNGSVIRVVDILETVVTNEIKVPMNEVCCLAEWQGFVACACSNGQIKILDKNFDLIPVGKMVSSSPSEPTQIAVLKNASVVVANNLGEISIYQETSGG